jgi:hypothetical protein
MHKVNGSHYIQVPCLEFIQLLEGQVGLIFRIDCFLENYVGTDDWQFRYTLGRYYCVRHTTQGRKTHTLWVMS